MSDFQLSSGCQIVAEIAQAHDGSLGTAHAMIEAAKFAGADAVKFQMHIATAESTREEPWRVPFSRQDASRFDYWKRMEFTEEGWRGLAQHARDLGLKFVLSPFSTEAVELGDSVGVDAWKIASGELGHARLLEAILSKRGAIIVSSGMSDWAEISRVAQLIKSHSRPFALLQCDTRYPSPPESWGLNVLGEMRAKFSYPIGFSDHSGDIFAGLAAAALGANLLEVHLTLSKEAFGPDVPASLDPAQLRLLVTGVKQIVTAALHPIDKDVRAAELAETRAKFSRSVALKSDLPAGTRLLAEHLTLKKPSGGFGEGELDRLVGRTLSQDVTADVLLRETHLKRQEAI